MLSGLAISTHPRDYLVLGNEAPDKELVWMAGLAGAIVGFLGLGNLAYYFLARKRTPDEGTSKV